ncbi:hypothetical protein A4X13_0g7725 [Tilletia indica]|uniref:Uncharacterized protein n=1 Tax=Tilletia indica TaxID=43049 RepID=A0A177T5P7_9BASI|nr:hypothetical protein A4X13_0g7725 [Tilletia indica]
MEERHRIAISVSRKDTAGANDNGVTSDIFVGGLGRATEASLRNYMSQFGNMADCRIVHDLTTRLSRGLGFITFQDPNVAN